MTDPHNCGYDPTWKGRDCGDHACFGGRCVFDTCNINQTDVHTRINLGIGNGKNVYYLAWYYAADGRNPPDHIALASTVPLSQTLGLLFAESASNPGFYDLKVESLQLFLGYSPTTGYMVWNDTAGPSTGIWRTDGCDGAMVMTYKDQTYHFAVDENNFAIARPDTTSSIDKRFLESSNYVSFAMRHMSTIITTTRCRSSKPAQKIPLDSIVLQPNGCGPKGFLGRLIPEYRFGNCCNHHDTCYSNCARNFQDCNDDFLSCMGDSCEAIKSEHPKEALACFAAARWYWLFVSSLAGFEVFTEATIEACETCPGESPKDLCGKYHGSDGAPCQCSGYQACDYCVCNGWGKDQIGHP
jgi:hypothetical protein